jgi:hypothetical protein
VLRTSKLVIVLWLLSKLLAVMYEFPYPVLVIFVMVVVMMVVDGRRC